MNACHTCLLCLGSNSDASLHLFDAEKVLDSLFAPICWGEIVQTAPEGINDTRPFYNRCALFRTSLEIEALKQVFKAIERENGRTPEKKIQNVIPLDIDLLRYDDHVLKPEDMKKAYVQKALRSLSRLR